MPGLAMSSLLVAKQREIFDERIGTVDGIAFGADVIHLKNLRAAGRG